MTTTAFDDQFTPATQTILRVNVIESQQQIHDLQLKLTAAIERAEKAEEKLTTARDDMQSWIDSRNGWMERAGAAEAELAKLREQKPVAWQHENGNIFLPWQKALITTGAVFSPLYAAPVPAPHKGATHCDDCGMTWLDDGLNPLECPYCKDTVPAPAVPAEWREALQEAHDTFQRYADLHRAKDTRDGHEKAKLNQKLANKLYVLLGLQQVEPPDCQTCANRGQVDGLSQETYCDSCIWDGARWKKNHYARK